MAKDTNGNRHKEDELLEAIWVCEENGSDRLNECLELAHAEVDTGDAERLRRQELIELDGERVVFTAAGRERARAIVRRHRLAERLFTDILGVGGEQSERAACNFEHAVVPEITESLCTLLGHPTTCPHGKPIPPGECCRQGRSKVTSAIVPLRQAPCGDWVKVAYLRPEHHDRLHQLLSLGIGPGAQLRLHQKSPVLVVEVDGSEVAMDEQVAGDVYVWRETAGD